MTGRGVPSEITAITAMAYASAAVDLFTGGGARDDQPATGWYQPNMDGGERVILLPEDGRGHGGEPGQDWVWGKSFAGYWSLDDIVAFDPKNPSRWWRRIGVADVLGLSELEAARDENRPVRLFRDPLSWLIAGRAGCVLIDRHRDPRHLLHRVPRVDCEDDAHAKWLNQRMRDFALRGMPKIAVAEPVRVAA
jgi:hypothetical protein